MRYKLFVPAAALAFLAFAVFSGCSIKEKEEIPITTSDARVTNTTKRCLDCHTKKMPSIVASWRSSSHAEAAVGCYECHGADPDDVDAFEHFGEQVAVIVSPLDCQRCHETEAGQFLASHHAKGGEVLGSLDNYLGEVVEGFGASVNGCQQCHGSFVKVGTDEKLTAETWPNFGIGRVNPDGSAGACSACHSRHDFSLAQARAPETCGKCHLGPDHPQKEVYESSKHAIAYRSHIESMHMDRDLWIVGIDYYAGPTCATCHVSMTPNQSRTHDIGKRISWNIRAAVSFKTEDSEQKRKAMREVCLNCHNPNYVDNFYTQFDAGILLYNEKFAEPAGAIMEELRARELIDNTPFNEEIEWTYFFLWHHEGRRARNGLAMMGPDYVQWHGFYEVAHRFYIEFVPQAEHLLPGVTGEVMAMPEHSWYSEEMSDKDREAILSRYLEEYR